MEPYFKAAEEAGATVIVVDLFEFSRLTGGENRERATDVGGRHRLTGKGQRVHLLEQRDGLVEACGILAFERDFVPTHVHLDPGVPSQFAGHTLVLPRRSEHQLKRVAILEYEFLSFGQDRNSEPGAVRTWGRPSRRRTGHCGNAPVL